MDKIEDIESNKYWNSNEMKKGQRFYVAFCLLNSAIFDYSVGLDLKLQNKLNWSASCFYYSMVHCARLLLFIPFGNYPTNHSVMINYLKNNNENIKFDWLDKFLIRNEENKKYNKPENDKELLIDLFKNKYDIVNFDKKLKQFSNNLANSKNLRQDSNYEALLIAHENLHPKLEELFILLSDTLSKKSRFAIDFIIEIFKHHIEKDYSEEETKTIKMFINESMNNKVKERIDSRISSNECKNEIQRILNKIEFDDIDINSYGIAGITDFETPFSIDYFDEKSRLINNFKDKITELRDSIY